MALRETLTAREAQVLELLRLGLTRRQVAGSLGLSTQRVHQLERSAATRTVLEPDGRRSGSEEASEVSVPSVPA